MMPNTSAPPANPLATSFARTFVPIIAGVILSILARWQIPGIDENSLSGFLEPALLAGYYTVFRLLEAKVDRRFGWFLGAAKTPVYEDPEAAAEHSPIPPNPFGDLPFAGGAPQLLPEIQPLSYASGTPVIVNVYNGPPPSENITEPEPAPEPKRSPRRRT